jgi:hypothetical protein
MNIIHMTAAQYRSQVVTPLFNQRDVNLELAIRISYPMDFLRHLAFQKYLWPHERKKIVHNFHRLTKDLQE